MANLNACFLIGNVTRDLEVRYTPKGTAVVDIGLAVNRHYSGEDGSKKEETTFVDITAFGRQAEVAGQYLKKGRPVMIEGRLHLETWTDKQSGAQRSKLKVICENLQLLGSKPAEASTPSEPPQSSKALPEHRRQAQTATAKPRIGHDPDLDTEPDDIPF